MSSEPQAYLAVAETAMLPKTTRGLQEFADNPDRAPNAGGPDSAPGNPTRSVATENRMSAQTP